MAEHPARAGTADGPQTRQPGGASTSDLTWQTQRLRQRAEELRTAAELIVNAEAQAIFRSLADDYDGMADEAERLAPRMTKPLPA